MAYPVLVKAYIAYIQQQIKRGKMSEEQGLDLIEKFKAKIKE